MRRAGKKRRKSTVRILTARLTSFSRKRPPSLRERIQSLEKRVEALELGEPIFGLLEKTPMKPGPRPKISDEDLWRYRDEIIESLELYWPELGPKLLSARGEEDIAAALLPYAGPETGRGVLAQRLIKYASALLSFLKSSRFHRKPPKQAVVDALNRPSNDKRQMRGAAKLPTRQIANAMAGVPELGWRTSLDRCSKVPSNLFIGKRTEDHYRALFSIPEPKRRSAPA